MYMIKNQEKSIATLISSDFNTKIVYVDTNTIDDLYNSLITIFNNEITPFTIKRDNIKYEINEKTNSISFYIDDDSDNRSIEIKKTRILNNIIPFKKPKKKRKSVTNITKRRRSSRIANKKKRKL